MNAVVRFLVLSLVLISGAPAAVYERFPGFKALYERADFVGIVTLVKNEVPEGEGQTWAPHRLFTISSVMVFKGPAIRSQIARLADRRIGVENADGTYLFQPRGEILLPETKFLVFLTGSAEGLSVGRYRWDEYHAEGAVLPVSPQTNLHTIDASRPFPVFEQIVKDYTAHCKALYEHAKAQERLLDSRVEVPLSPPWELPVK